MKKIIQLLLISMVSTGSLIATATGTASSNPAPAATATTPAATTPAAASPAATGKPSAAPVTLPLKLAPATAENEVKAFSVLQSLLPGNYTCKISTNPGPQKAFSSLQVDTFQRLLAQNVLAGGVDTNGKLKLVSVVEGGFLTYATQTNPRSMAFLALEPGQTMNTFNAVVILTGPASNSAAPSKVSLTNYLLLCKLPT